MSAAAGTRPVPTSLADWAGVSDLLPDFKLLLFLLWYSPSPPVVLEALRELDGRGLVVLDDEEEK